MSAAPTVVWLSNDFVPYAEAVVPIEDRGLQFGESLYEVVPITAGQVRMLEPHAARMRQGADLVGLTAGAPDDALWSSVATGLIEREGIREGILYAQLTGGTAPRQHVCPPSPTFIAYVRDLEFPREARVQAGLRAVTVPDTRWARCDVKTTMLLPSVLAKREAAARGADEAILVGPNDEIREGGSTNLFIVSNGQLITPPQTRHVLPGITRPMVSSIAREAGYAVADSILDRDRLMGADEVFLTSTTLLVMPIVAIDDQPIGEGTAGPIGVDLAARVRQRLELA